MSTFRKTVLATAIIGAGLATTAGSALASDCGSSSGHGGHEAKSSSGSCTNNVKAANAVKGGKYISALDGVNTVVPVNICDNFNNNKVLSDNSLELFPGVL